MLTYVSRFLSGDLDPFWPHVGLLSASVLASIAVGCGIILEGPKYSAAVHRVAFWLVVVGIGIEAICTIFLFVFDEGISGAQLTRIGVLDAELNDTRDTAKNALESAQSALKREEATAKRAEDAAALASKTLQDNIALQAKMADRKVTDEGRAIIRGRLKGDRQEVTVVVSGIREPQVYAASIGKALGDAGFTVLIDPLQRGIPPDTGVVFCANRSDDQKIYDVLRLARVATKLVSVADRPRPEFCDKPGIEAPIEDIIDRLSAGLLRPDTVGRAIPHGTLAKWHGPRIYVGQKPE